MNSKMPKNFPVLEAIQGMDIYLLDQLMKGRFHLNHKILDAGCGSGRNLTFFIKNGFDVYGLDRNAEAIERLNRQAKPVNEKHFVQGDLAEMPYHKGEFDQIICNAVLHFAASEQHFLAMFSELMRVLREGGQLFIRMTSDFGIADQIRPLGAGRFVLPDGSTRFLFTHNLRRQIEKAHHFSWVEPLKTVNVSDLRCMSTLVLRKEKPAGFPVEL